MGNTFNKKNEIHEDVIHEDVIHENEIMKGYITELNNTITEMNETIYILYNELETQNNYIINLAEINILLKNIFKDIKLFLQQNNLECIKNMYVESKFFNCFVPNQKQICIKTMNYTKQMIQTILEKNEKLLKNNLQ
jgi:hypothetical protein